MANGKKKSTLQEQDEKEKSRELTEAEKKRLAKFEALASRLIEQGYTRKDLTVGIVRANVFSVILLISMALIGLGSFYLVNRSLTGGLDDSFMAWMLLAFVVLVVVHEGIHGISWAIFAEHHFRDIEFGFMKQYLTPYCTCTTALKKGPYIFGALMPLITLGIIPMIISVLINSMPMMIVGIVMAASAAGDIMIVAVLLAHRSSAKDIVYIDHPTQAGGVIFEK